MGWENEQNEDGTSPPRGRSFWGVGMDGRLWNTYESFGPTDWGWINDGGTPKWNEWDHPAPGNVITALTTAVGWNGCMSLWALTDKMLHCRAQHTKYGGWYGWQKKSDAGLTGTHVSMQGAPDLTGICASMQRGSRGLAIWGIGADKKLHWNYETVVTGGGWNGWKEFDSPDANVTSLSALRLNDARVALLALSQDNSLYSNVQRTAGGPFIGWELGGPRFEDLPFIDAIENTLLRKPGEGAVTAVTCVRTTGNKFTRLDTPGLWGDATKKARGSDACKKLLDSITKVIGDATQRLDLTFLYLPDPKPEVSAFPDGAFQTAISDGFLELIKSGRKPSIRILFGVPLGGFWRKIYIKQPPGVSVMQDEQRWLEQIIEGKPGQPTGYTKADMKCPIRVAWGQSGSWNHTKIIVADDKIAITGGHNCWDDDYLGMPPTHDVSGLFEGPAAKAARLFCDNLWQHRDRTYSFSLIDGVFEKGTKKAEPPIPILAGPPPGHLEMLSLGRLGKGLANFSISSNASVTARIVALCKAKKTIRISQQSLRALTHPLGEVLMPPWYDFYTCLAIVRAVKAGVDVQIVLSGQQGKGYGGEAQKVLKFLQLLYLLAVLPPDSTRYYTGTPRVRVETQNRYYSEKCHAAPQREDIDGWVDLAAGAGQKPEPVVDERNFSFGFLRGYEGGGAIAEFNKKLKLATLYYADNSQSQSSNHSKVYIIDEDCFYVGSDNMYPSANKEGLQEFGYLIEDQKETKKFKAEYWDKLWEYSKTKGALN
jgi:phosphatidylserine/phosphatidylglycerophosphate/cardiolipin synthase-like enzyme